jgi:hypothetical protein
MQGNVSIMPKVGLMHAAVLVVVLTLAPSLDGQIGATYFVSKRGCDSNPGTMDSPWLTIQHAANLSAYGTSKTPITQLLISGNEVYDLRTGSSESVNVDGNVTHFAITNNLVHDNDHIGIDAIGYEGVGPVGYDEAMYGEITGNTKYNISGITNPGEGYQYDADGLYCDGCAYVTFERNVIFQVDYGIETTSENQVCQPNGTEWSGPNNTGHPAKGKSPCYGRYATVRNNIFYNSNACGNSIGGYTAASSKGGHSNGGGSSYRDAYSLNADPLFVDLKDTPPNFDTMPSSPAAGAGSTSLSCSVGWCDPHGSSPDSIMAAPTSSGIPGRTARTLILVPTKHWDRNHQLIDSEVDRRDLHSPTRSGDHSDGQGVRQSRWRRAQRYGRHSARVNLAGKPATAPGWPHGVCGQSAA